MSAPRAPRQAKGGVKVVAFNEHAGGSRAASGGSPKKRPRSAIGGEGGSDDEDQMRKEFKAAVSDVRALGTPLLPLVVRVDRRARAVPTPVVSQQRRQACWMANHKNLTSNQRCDAVLGLCAEGV